MVVGTAEESRDFGQLTRDETSSAIMMLWTAFKTIVRLIWLRWIYEPFFGPPFPQHQRTRERDAGEDSKGSKNDAG